jgi:nitrate/nitrite transport system ATP-binding protein
LPRSAPVSPSAGTPSGASRLDRIDLHRHPYYHALRNHIVDFLVSRSKSVAATVTDNDPRNVPTVRPGLGEPTIVAPPRVVETNSAQIVAR